MIGLFDRNNVEEKNDSYVYTHCRKDNGVVFYVGHGRTVRANQSGKGKTKDWETVVSVAGGYEVVKLHENLSKSEAIDLEEYYIKNPDVTWELVNKRLPTRTHELDSSILAEYFYYAEDSPSGLRYNKNIYKNKGALSKVKDSVAGGQYFDKNGKPLFWRVSVVINGKNFTFKAHRIVWCLVNGVIDSKLVIDHIDNDPLNNKIINLRLVTQHTNGRNKIPSRVNEEIGVVGLSKHHNSYKAEITDNCGNRQSKSFSINKYGRNKALYLAALVRYNYIVTQGGVLKFTDDHSCLVQLKEIIVNFELSDPQVLEPINLRSSNTSGFKGLRFEVNKSGKTKISAQKRIDNKGLIIRFDCDALGLLPAHAAAVKWCLER